LGSGAFSVGATVGVVVVVVVVVVVDSSGVSLSVLQAAVNPIIAMIAPPPTAADIRRRRRVDAISVLYVFLLRWSSGRCGIQQNPIHNGRAWRQNSERTMCVVTFPQRPGAAVLVTSQRARWSSG
jgi:hypothetical protein